MNSFLAVSFGFLVISPWQGFIAGVNDRQDSLIAGVVDNAE
jgi:hypothetical protein